MELRRRNIEMPQQTVLRLETIATLAVRMRETVRRFSDDCRNAVGTRLGRTGNPSQLS